MVKIKNGFVIFEHYRRAEAPVNLVELAQTCGYRVNEVSVQLKISTRQLERHFSNALGVSPKYWMQLQRMIRARQLIREGNPLKAITLELGFIKYDKFAQELKRFYGISPLAMVGTERQKCYDPEAFSKPTKKHRHPIGNE
jgi:transcriptional regulator GlxA family with amidase domain